MHDHHGHDHDLEHCTHENHRRDNHAPRAQHGRHVHNNASILVLRPYTGISGDIMVAGLARMQDATPDLLEEMIASVGMAELGGCLSLKPHTVQSVTGWQASVSLPHEHSHRTYADILRIITSSSMTEEAKFLAGKAFALIAEAEGAVHGKSADEVSFHEVGALDSILDVCLAAVLFDRLKPDLFLCGPLPLCDGAIHCAHGKLPSPAPATMRLLRDIPVYGIPTTGETITPTGIALLRAFGASYGMWPAMTIREEATIYGSRVFENVPNGAIFAYGQGIVKPA
ncbi:hypothetical protein FACS1894206_03970 [Deltaproteobacteria bacterium]|nr:hypothetical protein FACS1894206_03970 [Deltaproteobacteria bacterium]